MKRYAYLWITLAFFLVSIGLHWYFGWHAFVEEQASHGQPAELSAYLKSESAKWQKLVRKIGMTADGS